MRGTRGMGGRGGVAKHSGEFCRIFREMSSNIPEIILKHSGECPQTFWRMSSNILNVIKHSLEFRQTFRGIPSNKHRGLEMML